MSRTERAKRSHKPVTAEKYALTKLNEKRLAKAMKGVTSAEVTAAFDVITKNALIEVKTIVESANDKVTMHQSSRLRKLAVSETLEKPCYTVVFDERNGSSRIYWKEGVGSFRLGSMNLIGSLSALVAVIG